MAVAKSKLNSKLPKVADIRFCTSAGKNLCKGISTGENSKFSIAVNFKQPQTRSAFTSYQIQYRYCNQLSEVDKDGSISTNWCSWSNWANMKQFGSGKNVTKQGSTKNPDTWFAGNQGIAKTTYNQFWKWNNASIGGTYVQRLYQFRVRTYNGKNKTHGAWVTSETLSIKRLCGSIDETIHSAYGDAVLDFNLKWHSFVYLRVHSIKDSKNRELLTMKQEHASQYDKTRSAKSTPPLRNGYIPSRVKPIIVKRALVPGEKLTVNIWAETEIGAKTYWPKTITVSKIDYEINKPRATISVNKATGIITVTVFKTDADDVVLSGNVRLRYTYNGKEYTLNPYSIKKNLAVKNKTTAIMTATFPFAPLNTDLSVLVDMGNGIASKTFSMGKTRIKTGRLWIANKANAPNTAASVLVANEEFPSFEIRSQGKMTVELPYGRTLPFAAYSPGVNTTIQIEGLATESSLGMRNMPARSAPRYWHTLRNNPGIYYLRGPDGEMYKCALEEVQMNRGKKDFTEVIATFQEVS